VQFGGWRNKQIIGWRDLDKVQDIIAPHCLRRMKADCLDLPKKIGGIDGSPIIREVALTQRTWELYKRLRNEAILSLPDTPMILETNGAVRLIRLAQITSGHVTTSPNYEVTDDKGKLFLEPPVEQLSHEKLDYTVDYLKEWSSAEASIVWCRFRPERERLAAALRAVGIKTYEIYGGQNSAERETAKLAFHPTSRGSGRRVLVAQPHAGGKGLDFSAATEALYQSNDWSLEWRQQSEDRSHRSGTIEQVSYIEILATGPTGQKTIDHTILRGLRGKQNLAAWTCRAWRDALVKERNEEEA
jgi:SNF2 family DNA or RNA helicase